MGWGGGAGVFAWSFFFISQGRLNKTSFFHLYRIGCKYINFIIYIILISNCFVDKTFIPNMPCGHLFISPIFPTEIFISEKLCSPHYSNGDIR